MPSVNQTSPLHSQQDITLKGMTPQDIEALLDCLEFVLNQGISNRPASLVAIRRRIRNEVLRIVEEARQIDDG